MPRGIHRVSHTQAGDNTLQPKAKMECMQKKYEPTEVLHKGSDNSSVSSYENDEDMIDIMDVWKANYAIHQESQLQHHQHHHQHMHNQFQLEYPSTSDTSGYYEADDNCNTVEYDAGEPDQHASVTEVIRTAVQKAGAQLQEDKRRVSRQFLTNLNIAQLQVIVNDLQRYIELLNDELVLVLMERDELQMSQDATLIDIEDLSLYLSEEMQNKHPRN